MRALSHQRRAHVSNERTTTSGRELTEQRERERGRTLLETLLVGGALVPLGVEHDVGHLGGPSRLFVEGDDARGCGPSLVGKQALGELHARIRQKDLLQLLNALL